MVGVTPSTPGGASCTHRGRCSRLRRLANRRARTPPLGSKLRERHGNASLPAGGWPALRLDPPQNPRMNGRRPRMVANLVEARRGKAAPHLSTGIHQAGTKEKLRVQKEGCEAPCRARLLTVLNTIVHQRLVAQMRKFRLLW